MLVSELIELLQEYPPDMEVLVEGAGSPIDARILKVSGAEERYMDYYDPPYEKEICTPDEEDVKRLGLTLERAVTLTLEEDEDE